ncbi:MAG: amidohydrolase family protein [Chloroflexi bacterium]|nr:amidohydrolase family protein [Chloroflexota bacterium]
MPYDLLLKGGHVLDPGQNLDGIMDIAVSGGKIAAIQPNIDAAEAAKVVQIQGQNRYVTPGLIDIHTHVAYGAQTKGVGMQCCDPDEIGVQAGVTTVLDCGSVGVANIGVFPIHILPKAKTRCIVFLNVGSYAHTMPNPADINSMDEVDRKAIAACVQANPGLIKGIKLRVVGNIMDERGEEIINLSKAIAAEHNIPLMVHIGDMRAKERSPEHTSNLTRHLLRTFTEHDVLTHLCTPHVGGVMDSAKRPVPELNEARNRGVVLDPALGMGNFGYEIAREQAQLGLLPDTLSSDLTAGGMLRFSLMECMAKFMAVGYKVQDVVRMTTANAAKAIGLQDEIGVLKVGRDADITVMDVIQGKFKFVDTIQHVFNGDWGIVPVTTFRAGEQFAPRWGTHAWGWLPEAA